MEKKLFRMFESQDFEGCSALQRVIDNVHSRYTVTSLDLDDLEWIAAAGDLNQTGKIPGQDQSSC